MSLTFMIQFNIFIIILEEPPQWLFNTTDTQPAHRARWITVQATVDWTWIISEQFYIYLYFQLLMNEDKQPNMK